MVSKQFLDKTAHSLMATMLVIVPFVSFLAPQTASAAGGGDPCLNTATPYASFASATYKGVGSLEASLNANNSLGCGDQVVNYAWDFGDGIMASGVNASHTYSIGSWQTTLTVTDEAGLQNSSTKTFVVKASNEAPAASDSNVQADQGKQIIMDLGTNVIDADQDALEYTFPTLPAHGAVYVPYEITPRTPGTYAYRPDYDFYGTDSFTYQVSDGFGGVATAKVSITVRPNLTAGDDYATTDQGKAVTINVLANDVDLDGDFLWVWVESTNSNAKVNPDSTITYQPNANATGEQTFIYYISDSSGHYRTSTVHVTVNPAPVPVPDPTPTPAPTPTPTPTPIPTPLPTNTAPVASSDSFTTNEDTQVSGNVLLNDRDADNDSLHASVVSSTSNGSLQLSDNGTFFYTPKADWNGIDSFKYKVSDGKGGTSTTEVTIVVSAVNDAPIASFSFTTANPHTVYVNAAGSGDIEGPLSAYKWNFGDGTSAAGSTSQHRYSKGGTYQVTLTVTDNQGANTSTIKQVQVK
jgi:VCBS repeat-containing protein